MSPLRSKINRALADRDFADLLKGFSTSFSLKLLGVLMSYLFSWLIAKQIGADGLGSYTLAITLANIAIIFSRLGMNNALVKLIAGAAGIGKRAIAALYLQQAFRFVVVSGLIISGLLWFGADFIAKNIFAKPHLTGYLQMVAFMIIPASIVHLTAGFFRGRKEVFKFSLLVDFLPHFIRLSSTAVLILLLGAYAMLPLHAWMLAWGIDAAIACLLIFLALGLKKIKFKNRAVENRSVLMLALPMLLVNSMNFLLTWTDNLMLGVFVDTAQIGYYRVAVQVAILSSLMLQANRILGASKFAEYYEQGELDKLKNTVHQSTFIVLMSSIPVLTVIILAPAQILGLFGDDFVVAVPVLLCLAFAQFVNASTGLVAILLNMTGKQVLVQNILILTAIINIALNYLFIREYGILGAAIATAISMVFRNTLLFFYVKKHLGFYSLSLSPLLRMFRSTNS